MCSDLRDNIERAASAYSHAAGLIHSNDFILLQVPDFLHTCIIVFINKPICKLALAYVPQLLIYSCSDVPRMDEVVVKNTLI